LNKNPNTIARNTGRTAGIDAEKLFKKDPLRAASEIVIANEGKQSENYCLDQVQIACLLGRQASVVSLAMTITKS